MKQQAGTLTRQGKNIMVQLPTKSGTANFPIPMAAKRFNDADFQEGIEALVERDDANRIQKVTIPGKAEPAAPSAASSKSKHKPDFLKKPPGSKPFASPSNPSRGVKELRKASPKILGEPFHNAYTFIDFEDKPVTERGPVTLASADEIEPERLTGVLELTVETQSPLLTSDPIAVSPENESHKTYKVLSIGTDVIVPSTGIRGSLRTLLTTLTNGTLGYLDRTAFLIQGRDAKLGPCTPQTEGTAPDEVYLGEVVTRGSDTRSGTIRLGETKLVKLLDLENLLGRNGLNRAPNAKPVWIKLDASGRPTKFSDEESHETPWRLRLSGRPVGGRRIEERKREAVFRPCGDVITIRAKLWADYCGRYSFGDRPTLRPKDLVWLQPIRPEKSGPFNKIRSGSDVESLQWARWGKTGQELKDKVPVNLQPDSWARDGKVDEVTNMFGQVADVESREGETFRAISFAGRIHPENLVFQDAARRCQKTTLAPLAPPHPGCLPFYRNNTDPDKVSFEDQLRGYKVYRTTNETGANGPWNYDVQGVYDRGQLKGPRQNVNKTVDLLPAGETGTLRVAFHALTKRELALLIQACNVTWRIGGGKPLGLGRCKVTVNGIMDEFGKRSSIANWLGEDWQSLVSNIQARVRLWETSQTPVARMRYPRAVNGNSRGGHAWFQYFGRPRMVSAPDNGAREKGLMPVYITGELRQRAEQEGQQMDPAESMISGQILPKLSATDPDADILFGYDVIGTANHDRRNVYEKFEPFDPSGDDLSRNVKEENQGKNSHSRRIQRVRSGQCAQLSTRKS